VSESAPAAPGAPEYGLSFEPSNVRLEVAAAVLDSLVRAQPGCNVDEFIELFDRASRIATSVSYLAGAVTSGFVGGMDACLDDRRGYTLRVLL
jgi:hypothetical protein